MEMKTYSVVVDTSDGGAYTVTDVTLMNVSDGFLCLYKGPPYGEPGCERAFYAPGFWQSARRVDDA